MRIRNDQRLFLQNGVAAKGYLATRLAGVYPVLEFEPLAVAIHQLNQGDGDTEGPARQPGNPVETAFGHGIEDAQCDQRAKSRRLINRSRRRLHK